MLTSYVPTLVPRTRPRLQFSVMLLKDYCRHAAGSTGVWLLKQLKGTAWLSAVSSQSGRGTRGARVVQVGAGWAGRGAKIEV